MVKRRTIFIAVGCLPALVALAVFLTDKMQPYHKGRSLSRWLAIYSEVVITKTSPDFEDASGAVRAIGTNALPFFLKWIRYEHPSWHSAANNSLPAFIVKARPVRFIMNKDETRACAAEFGFGLLSTNAVAAIPELKAMMGDTSHPETAARAIAALSSLGAPAFPDMAAALADRKHPYRAEIALGIGLSMAGDIGTNICLPALRTAMDDPDGRIRSIASQMVARLIADQGTNAPSQ